ncbi:DNA-3-methyladenine glycosylase [Lewinella sp. 4G2]|uniref:DNA-3-methyladenine glycosylase family protein n=1 Tax=Lewinella sp. 4G2 TaxID=1803372 RepID=UPI0007B4CEA2|nr:hypothetical protein [Lewinella sp. 4G2]OAV45693.1 hypothetical protein A3850_014860 [Lewinella sp. 4G2]
MNQQTTNHLSTNDPIIANIVNLITIPTIPPSKGIYHDMISCIVEHQIPSHHRNAWFKKVVNLLNGKDPNDNNIYTIQEDDWRAAKLAAAKYHTLFRFTDAWHKQRMETQNWTAMTDDEVRQQLTAIKGIGPATADLVLLYSLGRPDVLLANDSHVKQMVERLYLEPEEKLKPKIAELKKKWSPYCSLASLYLIAYRKELKRRKP